jgi:hypothetical protein
LYEQLATILYKPLVHINDMAGGLIKLGWACQPNNIYEPSRLVLFVDNLLTYGANYNLVDPSKLFDLRSKRLEGIKDVAVISRVLTQAKDEINLI